ncbi:MAG: hypothetical protein Q4A21_01850 [bacterium]|nr:hypothetical protein [bacterium]
MKNLLKKLALGAIVMLSIGGNVVHANTDELRNQLNDIFKDTPLVQPEQVESWTEKGKEKWSEIRDKAREKFPEWKERAADTFSESKEWIKTYSDAKGISSVPAEGFAFFDQNGDKITEQIFVAAENKTVRRPEIYFTRQDGSRLESFTFEDVFDEVNATHRFLRITSPRKIRSRIFHSFDIFKDSAYYVWAELEFEGVKIVRPVPVSKETFKALKKSAEGTEFKALYQK